MPDADVLGPAGPGKGGAAASEEGRAKKIALALILIPVFLTLLWAVATRMTREPVREEARPPIGVGLPAPNFTFPTLVGGAMALSEQRGKVVLINVWATWCPPCLEEMPSLQNLYARMKADGEPFEILAVSIDALGGDVVQKFADRYKLTFPILLDPRGKIKKLYATTGVPETFIVDPQGRLVQKIIGAREWDTPDSIAYMKQVSRLGGQGKPSAAPPTPQKQKPAS